MSQKYSILVIFSVYGNEIAMENLLLQKKSSQMPQMLSQLLGKSFEVIKTLTPKVSSLYQFNEELEKSVSAMERKFTKIERDNEDLQYNLRKRMLDIEMKVNCSVEEIGKTMEEVHWFKKSMESYVKMAKEKNGKESCKKLESQQKIQRPIKTRKIMFQDQIKQLKKQQLKSSQKPKEHIKPEAKPRQSLLSCSQISLLLPMDSMLKREDRRGLSSQKQISRKGNIKNTIPCYQTTRDIWDKNSNNSQKIDIFLKEMEDYQLKSQKIRNNYQQLLDEYNAQYQVKFHQVEHKLKEIQSKMGFVIPTDAKMKKNHVNFQIQAGQQNKKKIIRQQVQKISDKLDKNIFQIFSVQLQQKLNTIRQQVKQGANREQTRKAIQFLQQKLNLLFEQNPHFSLQKPSMKTRQMKMDIVSFSNFQKPALCLKKYKRLSENEASTIRYSSSLHNKKKSSQEKHRKSIRTQEIWLNQESTSFPLKNSNIRNSGLENEETIRPSLKLQMREKEKRILKQKTIGILTASSKTLGKLKKERLVFQYD